MCCLGLSCHKHQTPYANTFQRACEERLSGRGRGKGKGGEREREREKIVEEDKSGEQGVCVVRVHSIPFLTHQSLYENANAVQNCSTHTLI